MTTIINSPTPVQGTVNESSGSGFLVGTILFVVFLAVILYFAIPALNRAQPVEVNVPAPQVNVPTPQINVEAPEVVVPDKVEVEVVQAE